MRKFLVIVFGIVVLLGVLYFTFLYNATYSEGLRSGELIKFSSKGMVFKTYEVELSKEFRVPKFLVFPYWIVTKRSYPI